MKVGLFWHPRLSLNWRQLLCAEVAKNFRDAKQKPGRADQERKQETVLANRCQYVGIYKYEGLNQLNRYCPGRLLRLVSVLNKDF